MDNLFLNWNAYRLSVQNSPIQNSPGKNSAGRCSECKCGCECVIKQPVLCLGCRKEPLRWPDRCCCRCAATPTPHGAQGPEPRLQHPKWRGPAGVWAHSRVWDATDVWGDLSSYNWWVSLSISHKLLLSALRSLFTKSLKFGKCFILTAMFSRSICMNLNILSF